VVAPNETGVILAALAKVGRQQPTATIRRALTVVGLVTLSGHADATGPGDNTPGVMPRQGQSVMPDLVTSTPHHRGTNMET